MARTKDQAARRQQLVPPRSSSSPSNGIEALTLAAIADQVGVSHRLVAYYYADLESLVQEAHEAAVQRYYWARLRTLDEAAEPEPRLLQLIRSGLPGPQDRQAEPGAERDERQRQPQRRARRADGEPLRSRGVAIPVGPRGRRGQREVPAQRARPDGRAQPGRARGRLRLPPAREDLTRGRGHRAGGLTAMPGRPPVPPCSAGCDRGDDPGTASSVSRSSGWLSGSGQCDSLTTTVRDGGWTKMFGRRCPTR